MSRQAEHWRFRIGMMLIVFGALLIAVTEIAHLTSADGYYNYPARSWERFDPEFAKRTPNLESLYRAAQARAHRPFRQLRPGEKMQILYEAVADRFTHGDLAKYSPISNWFLWSLGAINPLRRDIQDPDVLLRHGHSALCGDVSYVLIKLAEKAGIPARHVLLEGHILMEAWYEGGWHAYDPDIEVIVRDGNGEVYSVEHLIHEPSLLREAYSPKGDRAYVDGVVAMFTSVENNRYIPYSRRDGVGVEEQRPGWIERAGIYAATVLPAGMILTGALLARRTLFRGRRSRGQ